MPWCPAPSRSKAAAGEHTAGSTVDGLELCRTLRVRSRIPVIMLTARGDEMDRILGLEMGADDYLLKPFSARELLARIKVVLRRVRELPLDSFAGERDGTDLFGLDARHPYPESDLSGWGGGNPSQSGTYP